MALAYAALGLFAAATGRFFGAINSSPWTFLVVGNIILLFGLGMLDVVQIPTYAGRLGGGKRRWGLMAPLKRSSKQKRKDWRVTSA